MNELYCFDLALITIVIYSCLCPIRFSCQTRTDLVRAQFQPWIGCLMSYSFLLISPNSDCTASALFIVHERFKFGIESGSTLKGRRRARKMLLVVRLTCYYQTKNAHGRFNIVEIFNEHFHAAQKLINQTTIKTKAKRLRWVQLIARLCKINSLLSLHIYRRYLYSSDRILRIIFGSIPRLSGLVLIPDWAPEITIPSELSNCEMPTLLLQQR